MPRLKHKQKKNIVNTVTRYASLGIALISTIAVIFPALLGVLLTKAEIKINPFELGIWAFPVLAANIAIFGFVLLYYKKILPSFIQNSLTFIQNFEISKKVTLIILLIIFSVYIGFTYEELFLNELKQWADYTRIQTVLNSYPSVSGGQVGMKMLLVKNSLLKISEAVFQNTKVVPFIGTIALLMLIYFFTVQLTKKRFSGIIAILLTLQSFSFLRYDTLATYANFWTLFYILSLYLINKKWQLSPISYVASIFSKAITSIFLPLTFFFIYNTRLPTKKKIRVAITYIIVAMILLSAFFLGLDPGGKIESKCCDLSRFLLGFSAWTYQLRFEGIAFMFLLPLTVGLILVARKGNREADSILVLMIGTLLAAPLLTAATGYNIFPYRYIPFLIFFAIGVGVLVSNRITR